MRKSMIFNPRREAIKFKFGDDVDDTMVSITRIELRDIIASRTEELFEAVKSTLEKSGVPMHMMGNIVLTGGVSSIVGIDKLASEIFQKNVRIGYPNKFEKVPSILLNPANSCALGMLSFLRNLHMREKIKDGFESKNGWFQKFLEKLVG